MVGKEIVAVWSVAVHASVCSDRGLATSEPAAGVGEVDGIPPVPGPREGVNCAAAAPAREANGPAIATARTTAAGCALAVSGPGTAHHRKRMVAPGCQVFWAGNGPSRVER